VVSQDSEVNARKFFADNGGSWPAIGGDTGPISLDFGLKKLPESFLIDPSGVVVVKYAGPVTYKEVVGQIEKLTNSGGANDSQKGGS
ncbi:MAG: hypothetical protein WBF71_04005, partial [Microthrixaceae bacterium]